MDINKEKYQAELMAFNSKTGKYEWVIPKVLASSIYMEDGQTLDQVIKFTPDGLRKLLEEILDGAPEAYNSFKEVADALDANKDSIGEIFREISKRIKMPEGGTAGQVLKFDGKNIIFADDEDTKYDLSTYATKDELRNVSLTPGPKGEKGDPGDPATNIIKSVNGKTGEVTITKSDVGLGAVNNVAITAAQVTKINDLNYTKALTQAQYDALSTAEKNRTDVWYGIYKE